jgi:hypothetical protein
VLQSIALIAAYLAGTACIVWAVRFYGSRIMATLAEVNASIVAQTQAIKNLEASLPGPPAATEADLENVKKGIEDNTSLIANMNVPGKPLKTATQQPQPPQQGQQHQRDRDRNR